MRQSIQALKPRFLIHLLLIRPFLKLFFGVNVRGRDNFAGLDRYIIVANHNSHLDILLLFYGIPLGHVLKTCPVAAEEYFSRRRLLYRFIDYLFQPVWITRGAGVENSLEKMRQKLAAGFNMIIFPEGTRGEPGEIRKFKTGIGRLAGEYSGIPVVPIFLSGPERSLPKKSFFPLPIWNSIIIGPPLVGSGGRRDITDSLERMIRNFAQMESTGQIRKDIKRKPSFVLAVLGIDGSGKSTLARNVAGLMSASLSVCLVGDNLEYFHRDSREAIRLLPGEHVRKQLNRYAKKAKSLKQYKIPKLAELLLRNHLTTEVERWYHPDFIIMDGSPLLNLTAWSVLYRGGDIDAETCREAMEILSGLDKNIRSDAPIFKQFPELLKMRNFRLNRLRLPDAIVLLDVEPSVCIGRIQKRGESPQVHEKEDKLARLRDGYLTVCGVAEKKLGIPAMIMRGCREAGEMAEEISAFIQESRRKEQGGER